MTQPQPVPAEANIQLPDELYLDAGAVEQRGHRRREHHNTVTIPRLRFVGFQLVAAIVLIQNSLITSDPHWALTVRYICLVELYCIMSWLLLRAFYVRAPLFTSTFFLLLDTVLWTGAVYVTGANRSWLFPLVLVHAADNSGGSFRRVLALAHFGVACYALLVLLVAQDPAAGVSWPTEAAKIALLYAMAVYFSLTTRATDRLKAQARESARISRVLLERLEVSAVELRKRALETQRALELSEISSDTKDEFLANMSHELRTPLNSVIGFASVLLRKANGRLDETEINYLERIRNNGTHLLHLINDILDLSTLQAGGLVAQESSVDVRVLTASVVHSFQHSTYAKSVTLSLEADDGLDDVVTDAKRLRQILINLVGNAMKFTKRGSVRVRIIAEGRRPSRIEVIDTGIGIAADRLDAVFAPFEHADTRVGRELGGTGLGLSISRSLGELIGCRIEAKSEAGHGSTFTVILPGPASHLAQTG